MKGDIVVQGKYVYLKANNGKWYYFNRFSQPLGEGAMGRVYLGYTKPIYANEGSYPVAIKQIKDRLANIPAVRQRAKQEALLTFRHVNMIEIYGYCEENHDSGAFFMISNYVKGENIDIFIQKNFSQFRGKSRVEHILNMLYPIMEVLDYLHTKNIVHMDIKPSNIMVENGRNVRLMDLGIAHAYNAFGSNSSSSMMGTPHYAAPEQFGALNDNLTIDARTDVFEMGITLYELFTGKNPLKCPTLKEVLSVHENLLLPYDSTVPNAVVDVLRKATCRSKAFRFSSMKEFTNALKLSLIEKPLPWWRKIIGNNSK